MAVILSLSFKNAEFNAFLFLGFFHAVPNFQFCRNPLNRFSIAPQHQLGVQLPLFRSTSEGTFDARACFLTWPEGCWFSEFQFLLADFYLPKKIYIGIQLISLLICAKSPSVNRNGLNGPSNYIILYYIYIYIYLFICVTFVHR